MGRSERVMERSHREQTSGGTILISPPPATDRDADLVERLRRHERDATEALLAAYGDRAYRLAIRITGNSSDAEEVVQDALWAASRRIETFRGTGAFGSWVYRIIAHAACQKRRGRRSERSEVPWEGIGVTVDQAGKQMQHGSDWSPRLKDPATQVELRSVLRSAIDQLPAVHRTTFVLHDIEGLSNSKIAETLQIKHATVKSHVHRARLFLRSRLASYVGHAPS